jgi:hypothetical protein
MILENVLSLLVACVAGVGPIVLLAALQNRRDRRAQVLAHDVARQLPAGALRSDVAVDVRCALLSNRATVRLDLGATPSPRVWETAARLRRGLPASVRLEVDGRVEGPLATPRPVRITVESPGLEAMHRAA